MRHHHREELPHGEDDRERQRRHGSARAEHAFQANGLGDVVDEPQLLKLPKSETWDSGHWPRLI